MHQDFQWYPKHVRLNPLFLLYNSLKKNVFLFEKKISCSFLFFFFTPYSSQYPWMHLEPRGTFSGLPFPSTYGWQTFPRLQHRKHDSSILSQMQGCNPIESLWQKGIHVPFRHSPLNINNFRFFLLKILFFQLINSSKKQSILINSFFYPSRHELPSASNFAGGHSWLDPLKKFATEKKINFFFKKREKQQMIDWSLRIN